MENPTGPIIDRFNAFAHWAIVQLIGKYLADGVALRNALNERVDEFVSFAKTTETPWDDMLAQGLKAAIASDDAWAFFYGKLNWLYGMIVNGDDDSTDEDLRVKLTADGEQAGIDPATIVLIVNAIIQIVQIWRNRRNAQ